MLTGPLCLPATGVDAGGLILLAAIAMAFIAVGVIAVRRNKGVVLMILAPLAIIALAVGGTVSPAQAVKEKIADFTVSETWTVDGTDYVSEAPTAEELATLQQLEDLITTEATFTLTVFSEDGSDSAAIDPSAAQVPVGTGIASVEETAVNTARLTLDNPFGDLPLVYTITFAYLDDCGNPLTTTVTWTGTVFYPPPVP